jgi:hypothetical protein
VETIGLKSAAPAQASSAVLLVGNETLPAWDLTRSEYEQMATLQYASKDAMAQISMGFAAQQNIVSRNYKAYP